MPPARRFPPTVAGENMYKFMLTLFQIIDGVGRRGTDLLE